MKIRAIIPDKPDDASIWWRIERPFTMLKARGHDATWHNYKQLSGIDFQGAIVILHRIIPGNPNKYVLDLYAAGAKSVVYSMDDYTIDPASLRTYLEACGGMTHLSIDGIVDRIPRQLQTIELCESVIVSTTELAELVFEHVNKSIIVLSNAIDIDWYLERLSETPEYIGNSARIYIGWAGGRRPESDLEPMARAWQRVDNDFPQVRFVVAGWQPDIIDRHINLDKKIRIPWVPFDKWPTSMQVDIGCAPLADTLFNRGKSPIKFYEYSLAGAAVVASAVVYEDKLWDYISGHIVYTHTEQAWYDNLVTLIKDKPHRNLCVDNALYNLKKFQNLEVTIENWEYHLQRLVE